MLEFFPEGMNLDESLGRIRIIHNASMPRFIYLHLTVDAQSEAQYPDNLMWAYNREGETIAFDVLPKFDDDRMELLMESCFLE